jgi:hypothetical protein
MAGAGAGGLAAAALVARWLTDDPATRAIGDDRPATTAPATTATTGAPTATTAPGAARWSDPATWGGRVPGPDDVAVVDKAIVLDVDAAVAGVRIEPAGDLAFDAAASRTLTSTGNVVVAGALRARPSGPDVTHRVVFEGVDESRFIGDHTMEPLDPDVGVWVIGAGVLDLQGSPKKAWTNLAGSAAAGDTSISVVDAQGWQVGDEVVVTPTEPTSPGDEDQSYAEHHDRRTVAAVSGSTVTLDQPLDHSHPTVTVRPGATHTAEVLNLSRNVRIEGTPDGRAHVIFLAVGAPQTVGYVGLRHLGPQVMVTEASEDEEARFAGVVGRYSFHFHMGLDGTRGTVAEGLVAYDGGNSSFVPHTSHGITFRDCISHDQYESAFWWDQEPEDAADEGPPAVPTNDLLYERCVAHLVRETERSEYGLSAFMLGAGGGNVARGCVAVGVLGGDEGTAGYMWPDSSGDVNHTWTMQDCLSHNNFSSATYYWQNNVPRTIVDRFTSYHDRFGIEAGSYTNQVSYRDCTVYANRMAGLTIRAVPADATPGDTISYENLYIDQAGLTEYAVFVKSPSVEPAQATLVSSGTFKGGTKAQIGFPDPGDYTPLYEINDCTFEGNAFWLGEGPPDTVGIIVRDAVNGSIALRRAGQPGTPRREWNASVAPA